MVVIATNASPPMFHRGPDLVGCGVDSAVRCIGKGLLRSVVFPCSGLLESVGGALYHQGTGRDGDQWCGRTSFVFRSIVIPDKVRALIIRIQTPPSHDQVRTLELSQFTPIGGWWKFI
jgi:hypothetical protein